MKWQEEWSLWKPTYSYD